MTDHDPDRRVRDILSSQPAEPMPDDVASSLRDALADEARTRSVTPIGSGRRRVARTWLPRVAVAAVLLGILAIAVPIALDGGSDSSGSSASPGADAGRRPDASDGGGSTSESQDISGRPADGAKQAARPQASLTTGDFAGLVKARVVDQGKADRLRPQPSLSKLSCRAGRVVGGDGLPVSVDGRPAALYASGVGPGSRVTAVACVGRTPRVVASATVDTAP